MHLRKQMDVFAIPELLAEILELLPDIRVLRLCRALDRAVMAHPEYNFWMNRKPGQIYQVGKPKMFKVVPADLSKLYIACGCGNLPMVRYMIDHRADVQGANNRSVGLAAEHGHVEIVRLLVENRADISADGEHAFCSACWGGHTPVVEYLCRADKQVHVRSAASIAYAAAGGYLDIVRLMVDLGVDYARGDNRPFVLAAENGRLDIVQYLVGLGADPRVNSNYAVRYASARGHLPTVKYLVEHHADIHADRDFAVMRAGANGHADVVEYLIGAGAVLYNSARNQHLIELAAELGRIRVVRLLVGYGVDMHYISRAIRTASEHKKEDVVEYLQRLIPADD